MESSIMKKKLTEIINEIYSSCKYFINLTSLKQANVNIKKKKKKKIKYTLFIIINFANINYVKKSRLYKAPKKNNTVKL